MQLTPDNLEKILVYKLSSTFQAYYNAGSISFIYIILCILSVINFSFLITTSAFCCKLLTCCCGVSLLICFYFLLALNIDIKFLLVNFVEVLLPLANEVYFSFNYFLKNENILV